MEKPLLTAWVGLEVGWGRVSGDLQGMAVLASLMESQIWYPPAGSVALLEEGFRKGTMVSACFSVWE